MESTTTETTPARILTDRETAEFRRSRLVRRVARALVLAGLFAFVLLVVRPACSHLRSVFWLSALGANIEWTIDTETWRQGGVTSALMYEARVGLRDNDLKGLRHLHNLESLDLAQCDSLTDKGLAVLRDLTSIQDLDLSRNRVLLADEDVQPKLTDAVLVHVGSLSRLTQLTLAGNRITDAGLARLAGLTRLEYLDLRETRVTDAGLEPLKRLTRLKTLRLKKTRVTPTGAMMLRQALPEVNIMLETDDLEFEGNPDGR